MLQTSEGAQGAGSHPPLRLSQSLHIAFHSLARSPLGLPTTLSASLNTREHLPLRESKFEYIFSDDAECLSPRGASALGAVHSLEVSVPIKVDCGIAVQTTPRKGAADPAHAAAHLSQTVRSAQVASAVQHAQHQTPRSISLTARHERPTRRSKAGQNWWLLISSHPRLLFDLPSPTAIDGEANATYHSAGDDEDANPLEKE